MNISQVSARREHAHLVVTLIAAGCLLFLFVGWPRRDQPNIVAEAVPRDDSPPVAPFSVWRPYFFTTVGDHDISVPPGTAFVIRPAESDQPYLVTALQLLSPDTGLAATVAPGQIRKSVSQVVVSEAFGASDSTVQVDIPLELDLAQGDAAYWKEAGVLLIPAGGAAKKLKPLVIASSVPSLGDPVWLATAVDGGAPASQFTHRATVTGVSETGAVEYAFENADLSLRAATGAPLLNAAGEVVGMHVSRQTDRSEVIGTGISASRLSEALDRLL